uniref:Putative nucleic-acid-binding protein from transposon x-element n=1 Tax=Xenopsylla cheopis TaxID=163159 RepID=A0A6M2DQ16_XENCH
MDTNVTDPAPTTSYHIPDQRLQPEQNNWTVVQNRKRSALNNTSPSRKQQVKSNYWLSKPIELSNKFQNLTNLNNTIPQETLNPQPTIAKIINPPPIFIANVENINPLTAVLKEISRDKFTLKSLKNNEVKLQAADKESYISIIKALKEKDTEFHSYKMKEDRTYRVVLRNIHHSTDIQEIKTAIEAYGHEVTNIWNIKNKTTKIPLPLFYIDLKQKSNNKNIYDIKKLLNTIVTFEPAHVKTQISQCTNCQRFGHTKNFCVRRSRCVKCTGDHATKDCQRINRDENVICVNCGDNHPANYRSRCTIHKQIFQAKFPQYRQKPNVTRENYVSQGKWFASIAKNTVQTELPVNTTSTIEHICKWLKCARSRRPIK